jgi:hypothetical protein
LRYKIPTRNLDIPVLEQFWKICDTGINSASSINLNNELRRDWYCWPRGLLYLRLQDYSKQAAEVATILKAH